MRRKFLQRILSRVREQIPNQDDVIKGLCAQAKARTLLKYIYTTSMNASKGNTGGSRLTILSCKPFKDNSVLSKPTIS